MKVPYLDNDKIFHIVLGLLSKYNSSQVIPIPIEEIIELGLGLSILPVKGLEGGCKIDGSLSRDFKTILIDEYTYEKSIARSRMTPAHEVGHHTLHHDLYDKAVGFDTADSFIDFQNSLSEKEYKRLEFQAFLFAEEMLFPRHLLDERMHKCIQRLGGKSSLTAVDLGIVIDTIAKDFEVSKVAAFNRIRRRYPEIIETTQNDNPF